METKINHIKVDGNTRLSDDDIIRISNIYPGMTIGVRFTAKEKIKAKKTTYLLLVTMPSVTAYWDFKHLTSITH